MKFVRQTDSRSKAHWVLDAFAASKHESLPHTVMWGNISTVRSYPSPFLFTDMPYFNRWMGENRDTCHWRVIPDHVHCYESRSDLPSDRFDSLDIEVSGWRTNGDHILVCPSSNVLENYYGEQGWLDRTLAEIKTYTDRPIRVRHKPRANGTSGPRAATTPFAEDCKNAWAVVTLASIAGVEAACLGIPVFSHIHGPCAPLGNTDIESIESPVQLDRSAWLNTLAYYQYTESEIRQGLYGALI